MPIPVGVVAPPPPPPPPRPRPEPLTSWLSPVVTLHPSTGDPLQLTGRSGPVLMEGMRGDGLLAPEFDAASIPDGDGSVLLGIRYPSRELFVPVVLLADDSVSLRTKRRDMEYRLEPKRAGLVGIGIAEPDTGAEWIAHGYYAGGMEGSHTHSETGPDFQTFGLVFRCFDPLFYSPERTESWRLDVSLTRPYLSDTEPFFPVVLGESTIAGQKVLTNTGDEDAPVVLTIVGPTSGDALVENVTTGESLTVEGALLVGESVTIDGRPGLVDVFDQGGAQVWDRIPVGDHPWALVPGENTVRVTVAGATSVSSVAATWRSARRTGH